LNIESINDFFEINQEDNLYEKIFEILSKIISFEYCEIVFEENKYEFGQKSSDLSYFCENLKIKNTKIGKIKLGCQKFSNNEKILFKICTSIIANIIKDREISKIVKMQVEALQEGYLKVKKTEESKTKFISHFSHELRTPLNSILTIADILDNEIIGKLNKKQKEYISDIKVSGLNLLGNINDILDMSKIEAGAMVLSLKEFFITDVINEVENIISPLIKNKNLKFQKEVDEIKLCADFQKIQQILLNLLSNAIKYTPQGGLIRLIVKQEQDHLVIFVKDNGIGIPKEFQAKIFEKFEQAERNQKNSTGLGLAITKELVKMHNGRITVKSKPNEGAIFTVFIPLKNMHNMLQ